MNTLLTLSPLNTTLVFFSLLFNLKTIKFNGEMSIKNVRLAYVFILNHQSADFFKQTMETKGFFQFDIIINVLVIFFWIFYYGSTTIIYTFTLTVRGSTLVVRIWRLQTSDSDD